MKSIRVNEFNHFIHSVRNPLNSISLNAELGKMLIEDQGSTEKIKTVFENILKQCKLCEQTIIEMRANYKPDEQKPKGD